MLTTNLMPADLTSKSANVSPEDLVIQMDALLAEGRRAMEKADQFYNDHMIEPGIGIKKLLSDEVVDEDRVIFARLFTEIEMMEHRIEQLDPGKNDTASVSTPSVGARAIGNRYRI